MRGWAILLAMAGCVAPPPAPPQAPCEPWKPSEGVLFSEPYLGPFGAARTLSARSVAEPERFEVRSLGEAREPEAPRPRRAPRTDVRLAGARLDEAMRLIADAGGFNLVVSGELTQVVTIELRDVEPFEALVAIVEARGARVSYRGNIVFVEPASAQAAR